MSKLKYQVLKILFCLMLLIPILFLIPGTFIQADSLFESYTGSDGWWLTSNVNPGDPPSFGQTFTPSTSHPLTSITFRAYRQLSPGDLTIKIYNTGAGKKGSNLLASSNAIAQATITDDTAGGTYSAVFPAPYYTLNSGTMYAITFSFPNAAGSGNYRIRWGNSGGGYAGGTALSGANCQTIEAGIDVYFLEYGLGIPTVVTNAATNIDTDESADLNGNITATGGVDPTVRGFEYDTDSGAPYASDWHENGTFSTGAFSHELTSLSEGTTYYYRAYATNSQGTGYGAEESFTTFSEQLWYQPNDIISGVNLPDRAGTAHNGTINFGTADLSGNLTSFSPPTTPTPTATTPGGFLPTPSPTGSFNITPTPDFPGSDIIDDVAGDTPAQIPWMMITGFIILVVSLTSSWIMRRFGSGTIFVKAGIIFAGMAILIGLRVYDLWMLIFFVIIGVALMMGSRQPTWGQ